MQQLERRAHEHRHHVIDRAVHHEDLERSGQAALELTAEIGGPEGAVHRPDERVEPNAERVIVTAQRRDLPGAQMVDRQTRQAFQEAHPLTHSMPRLRR